MARRSGDLGKSVRIDGEPATIVGVAAPGFVFPSWLMPGFSPRGLHAADKRDVARTRFRRGEAGHQSCGSERRIECAGGPPSAGNIRKAARISSRACRSFPKWGSVRRIACCCRSCSRRSRSCSSSPAQRRQPPPRPCGRLGTRDRLTQCARCGTRADSSVCSSPMLAILGSAGAVLGLGLAWLGVRLFNDAAVEMTLPYWMVFAPRSAGGLLHAPCWAA